LAYSLAPDTHHMRSYIHRFLLFFLRPISSFIMFFFTSFLFSFFTFLYSLYPSFLHLFLLREVLSYCSLFVFFITYICFSVTYLSYALLSSSPLTFCASPLHVFLLLSFIFSGRMEFVTGSFSVSFIAVWPKNVGLAAW
jgi:hypothetical protein